MPAHDRHPTPDAMPLHAVELQRELEYWRGAYRDHPAFSPRRSFADYEPALKIGIQAFLHGHAPSFEEIRDGLGETYGAAPGPNSLDWDEASSAAAAAWHRMVNARRARRSSPKVPPARPATPVGTVLAR